MMVQRVLLHETGTYAREIGPVNPSASEERIIEMSSTATASSVPDSVSIDRALVAVIVPTFHGAPYWKDLSAGLAMQNLPAHQVLIVDTRSDDGTDAAAEAAGFRVMRISPEEFNHSFTRQLAARQFPAAQIIIYLTQDATPVSGAFDALLEAFKDPAVGAAYGRQLPRPQAGPIDAHARQFNYPAQSRTQTLASRETLGIKAAFFSNSFAAYRVAALDQAGGFPGDVIMAEDTIVAARMLMLGWKTAYVAEAQAYHSHSYTIRQEFQRYFDIGVLHAREQWLPRQFGKPTHEGVRFVLSELRTLLHGHLHLVPYALMRNAAKLIGYQLGLREHLLGKKLSRRLSYHTGYWDSPHNNTHPA